MATTATQFTRELKETKEVKEEKEQYERVTTEGDGNCAFNAFALGLSDGVLSGEITCPEPFYKKIAELFHPTTANAENFKKWLRTQTLVERQKKLQKILREIAVDEIRDSYSTFKDSYHAKLKVAYDKPDKDDIFKHHPIFENKMNDLREKQRKQKRDLEGTIATLSSSGDDALKKLSDQYSKQLNELDNQYCQELIKWFEETGKKSFFETLRQSARNSGDQERWGSEEELAALARYFRINIAWKKAGTSSYIGIGSGMIAGLSEEDRKYLVDLGFGDRVGTDSFRISVRDKASFSPLDAEFKTRLEKHIIAQTQVEFPLTFNGRKIEREVETQLKEQLKKDGLLVNDRLLLYKNIPKLLQERWKDMAEFIQAERGKRNRKMPDKITLTQRRWLEDRGIITRSGELEGKNGCPDSEVIFKKLADIPEKLKKKLEEAFSLSKLMFTVEHIPGHWKYNGHTSESQQKIEDEPFKQTVYFIDGLEDAKKKEIVYILNQIKNAPNPDKIRELMRTQLNRFLAAHQVALTKIRLNSSANLWQYLVDISIETVKKLADHFNKSPSSISVTVKKAISKKHEQDTFKNLLKLAFNSKKYEIDCEFSEVSSKSLKNILFNKRDLLIKGNSEKGIFLIREIGGRITAFYLALEEGCQFDKKPEKRCSLQIFSSSFLSDGKNNVAKNKAASAWEGKTVILPIKSLDSQETESFNTLSEFLKEDFLRSGKVKCKTRIQCWAVSTSIEYEFLGGNLLDKILSTLNAKKGIKILYEEYRENMRQKDAQSELTKNPSVAKTQQGFCYQEYLIMLLSYLATFDKVPQSFSLITEANIPEAWNDIVLEWKNQLIFFQQKHLSPFSTSVKKNYSITDLLKENKKKKNDISIMKYYQAYKKLIERINNRKDPLYRHQEKLTNKQLKFIFFTNKGFLLEKTGIADEEIVVGKARDKTKTGHIIFKPVPLTNTPLIDLNGFEKFINKNSIYQIKTCGAEMLELLPADQKGLNEFFESFYLFSQQKNAAELFEHCKKIIKYPPSGLGGFGQTFLNDDFSLWVHQNFVDESPEHVVLNRDIIKDFFENYETHHNNLVKYSCYNYPAVELQDLLEKYRESLSKLSCLKRITDDARNNVIVKCDMPLVGLAIIQTLFDPGERQVLTPFSVRAKDDYKLSSKCKYVIALGNDEKVQSIIKKIHDGHPRTRVIQIQIESIESLSDAITLKIVGLDLAFLCEDYPNISFFKTERSSVICLTDWLSLAIKPASIGLSEEEQAKYVTQTLSAKKTVLPYDRLEASIDKWIKEHPDAIARSWHMVGNYKEPECRLYINLPPNLPDIQGRNNSKFVFNKEMTEFYYVIKFQPVQYESTASATSEIDFVALEKEIEDWINVQEPFQKDCPPVCKIVYVTLAAVYSGALPSDKWELSTDKKIIYYYSCGKSRGYTVNWSDVYPYNRVTLIEAEAACGKTWYLKWLINEWVKNPTTRIPLFIRIKDLEKVSNLENPSVEMLRYAAFPLHVQRIAVQYPERFHLLLDGFDELATEFFPKFESILLSLINKGYSITVTVRDYQTTKLQEKVASIIIQQRLNQFDEPKIRECLAKYLTGKFMTGDLTKEVDELYQILTKHDKVREWLGIPLHVALIAEWYLSHRKQLVKVAQPTITEVYHFVLLNRIERHSKRNRSDIYKRLYQIAADELSRDSENRVKIDHSIFPVKRYQLKQAIRFDLASMGLLKDPFSNRLELFHRTFSEFLIAKRWSRKVIRSAGNNQEMNLKISNQKMNLKIVQQLYQTSHYLVRQFFIGLLAMHGTDVDVPYELTEEEQLGFQKKWLTDMNGKDIGDPVRNKRVVILERANQDNHSEPTAISGTAVATAEREIKNKKELIEILTVRDNIMKGIVVSDTSLSVIESMIRAKEISVSELLEIMQESTTLLSIEERTSQKVNCFNILGVFARIGSKEEVFQGLWGIDVADLYWLNPPTKWWSEDNFLNFVKYIESLKPTTFNRDAFKDYLSKCFALYQFINNKSIRGDLRQWIRTVNMECFLRDDYFLEDGQSIFTSFHDIKTFNIAGIKKAFDVFNKISKEYHYASKPNSYAFRYWSDDKSRTADLTFLMAILIHTGSHLNIIHVFYIHLYVSYGRLKIQNETIIANAIHHIARIEKIDYERDDLESVFCSILLFLSLISDWDKRKEHPVFNHSLVQKITCVFGRLLNASDIEISLETKLFIRILLVYFMLYFDVRGYFAPVSKEGLFSLTLFSCDGFIQELRIPHDDKIENMHQKIAQYFRDNVTIFDKEGIEQFEQLFTAWDAIRRAELVEEAVPVDTSEDAAPSPLVASDIATATSHKRRRVPSPARVQAPIESRSPVYLPSYSQATAFSPPRLAVPSSSEEHKSSPEREVKKARVGHE